jgi:hypothetical protein
MNRVMKRYEIIGKKPECKDDHFVDWAKLYPAGCFWLQHQNRDEKYIGKTD